MHFAVDVRDVRKAASFVEAIASLERDFGFKLSIPAGDVLPIETGIEKYKVRGEEPFGLTRNPKTGELYISVGVDNPGEDH